MNLEKIKNLKKEQWIQISVIIVPVFICLNFLFFPKIGNILKVRNLSKKASLSIKEQKSLITKKIPADFVEKNINLFKDKFYLQDKIYSILQYLTKSAGKTNISIISIDSKPIEKQILYDKLAIEVIVLGEYSNIINYLDELAESEKIVDIQEIQIRKDETIFPKLNVRFLINTYTLKG
jgi:Tfp pilus assembly protein PilO